MTVIIHRHEGSGEVVPALLDPAEVVVLTGFGPSAVAGPYNLV
jgi:hypothetical protein